MDQYSIEETNRSLLEAENFLRYTQERLVETLEGGAKLASITALEASVDSAAKRRDELREHYAFLMERYHDFCEKQQDMQRFFSLAKLYKGISRSVLGKWCLDLTAQNDATGLTGCVYILRGWIGLYIEGPSGPVSDVIRVLEGRRKSAKLCEVIESLRVIFRDFIPKEVKMTRAFPNVALKIIHLDDVQLLPCQSSPASVLFREIIPLLSLVRFIPELNVANKGEGHTEAERFRRLNPSKNNGLLQLDKIGLFLQEKTTEIKRPRYIFFISPSPALIAARGTAVEAVLAVGGVADRELLSLQTNSFTAGLVAPHSVEGLMYVVISVDPKYVLERAVELTKELCARPVIYESYKPVVGVHFDEEVGLVMDGKCTAVGNGVRVVHDLVKVGRKEGCPVVISGAAARRAGNFKCRSLGEVSISNSSVEVFVPNVLYEQLLRLGELIKEENSVAEKSLYELLDTHVEGPGPVEMRYPALSVPQHPKHYHNCCESSHEEQSDKQAPEHITKIFNSLPHINNNCISRETFDKYFRSIDHMGVPVDEDSINRILKPHENEPELTLNQFAYALKKHLILIS